LFFFDAVQANVQGWWFFLGGIWVIGKDMGWVKVVIKYYIGIEKRQTAS
jgi:hypothetical protein